MLNVVKNFSFVLGLWAVTPSLFAQSTSDVWNHHIQTWQARDLDGITSDYSEDSVLILNNEVFQGTAAIRRVFEQLFQIFDHGENRIDEPVLHGRIVYITWHYTPAIDKEFFGTDTFVIEDGKIAVQTIASPLYEAYPIIRLD